MADKVEEKIYILHKIQGLFHHKDKFHCLTQATEKEDQLKGLTQPDIFLRAAEKSEYDWDTINNILKGISFQTSEMF